MSNPYASPDQQNDGQFGQPGDVLTQSVRQLQIVTGALVMGACMSLGIVLFVNGKIDGVPDITTWIGVGLAGLLFFNHLVIPGFLLKNQLGMLNSDTLNPFTDDEKMASVLGPIRATHIVACAMLEGAAFLNIALYMVNDCVLNLITAAVMIALLLLKMPTVFGMHNKVMDRLREIEMR